VILSTAGGTVTAIGFAVAGASYTQGMGLYPDLSGSDATYHANIDEYRRTWTAERVGIVAGSTGAALLTAGLVRLLVDRIAAKTTKETASPAGAP
jgi:hypothetical protein